jgi:hypothetical protein
MCSGDGPTFGEGLDSGKRERATQERGPEEPRRPSCRRPLAAPFRETRHPLECDAKWQLFCTAGESETTFSVPILRILWIIPTSAWLMPIMQNETAGRDLTRAERNLGLNMPPLWCVMFDQHLELPLVTVWRTLP